MAGSDLLVGITPYEETKAVPGGRDPSFGMAGDGSFAALFSGLVREQASSQLAASVSGSRASAAGALQPAEASSAALLASMSDGEGFDAQLGILLMFMLMGSSSDADGAMLSSLLAAVAAGKGRSAYTAAQAFSEMKTLVGASAAYTGGEMVPEMAWIPTSPAVTGDESCRSPELLERIIAQFNVESSARYTPYKNGRDTYCNIFVWDVTSALGAEIPHYVDAQTGQPRRYPDTAGARELDANGVCRWLSAYGSRYGWTEVSAETAQEYANRGYPAVTAWQNPAGAGHVQVVRPSKDGAYDAARGVAVAQAGRTNREYTYAASIYGRSSLSQVRYFVHA